MSFGNAQPLDESSFQALSAAHGLHEQLNPMLIHFAACREIDRSVFEGVTDLKAIIDYERDHVEFTYGGVTVRLTLVVGIREGSAEAKIVATYEYGDERQRRSAFIGEFMLDHRGRTNFTNPANGKLHYTHDSADLIVAHFLEKALKHKYENSSEL